MIEPEKRETVSFETVPFSKASGQKSTTRSILKEDDSTRLMYPREEQRPRRKRARRRKLLALLSDELVDVVDELSDAVLGDGVVEGGSDSCTIKEKE